MIKILNYIKSIELVDKYIKVFIIEDFISKYFGWRKVLERLLL
jgi:hypothetical protein